MSRYNQLLYYKRKRQKTYKMNVALRKCPQKRGVILKIMLTKPKKPNSAVRKVAKLRLTTKKNVFAYIIGLGYNLHEHNRVLIRGGRVRDVPGMHYKIIKGVLDFLFTERIRRRSGRSKYGIPLRQRF